MADKASAPAIQAAQRAEAGLAPSVSILMVGYNSVEFLPAALGSIGRAAGKQSFEIRFVNNGTDQSEIWLRDHFPEVAVLPSLGNIGFGAANNYLAADASGEWLLLLNPDTRLEPDAIDILVSAAQADANIAAAGGLSLDRNGRPLALSTLAFPTFRHFLRQVIGGGGSFLDEGQLAQSRPVEAVSGGFMLIRRDWWDGLGGFDERFFLYAEELDLCWRLHQRGGTVVFVPAARIMHDVGSGDAASPMRKLFVMRGMATFTRKHFSPLLIHACLLLQWLACAIRLIAALALRPFGGRFAPVVRMMQPIVLKPWTWWKGYPAV